MAHKPSDVAVLNVMQALGADVVLSGGKLQLNDGSVDLLSEALKIADGTSYSKVAYSAGVAQIDTVTLTGVSLAANSIYRIAVEFSSLKGFNTVQILENGGRGEANQLIPVREYVVSTGTSAPSADELKDLFIARINADAGALVTASSGGVGIVTLTQDNVADGEFSTTASSGAVVATPTPYVAPSGTPAIVEALAPTFSSPTAQYSTWTISLNRLRRHNAVSGGSVYYPEFIQIFADEGGANFAAFETALDDVLSGAHTPVADYLGI